MKNILIVLSLMGFSIYGSAQELSIYNPQLLYDEAGGMFDTDILRNIHIDFEDSGYHQVLTESFFLNPALRIPATISVDDISIDSVGVRYKGNSTFCLPNDEGNVKLPYNLDFNFWASESDLMGYHKIKLANAWLDPTFAKEFMGAKIYRRYLPTPEVNLLALHTQGDYTGLYVNTESINKQFVDKHFNEDGGVLFKCDGAQVFCGDNPTDIGLSTLSWLGTDSTSYYSSYILKSEHGWGELQDLIYTINYDQDYIEDVLNVDRVLWAFAVNQAISNLDTYNGYYVHNYYLYLAENGLWQMIPWDFDNSFVGAIMAWDYFTPENVYHFDPYNGAEASEDKPLTNLLLNNPQYRKQYNAHLRTIMEESLDLSAVESEVNAMQELAFDAASADDNKLFGMDQYSLNVDEAFWVGWGFGGILSTIEARLEYLNSSEFSEINGDAPVISGVELIGNYEDENGHYTLIRAEVEGATEVELMATTSEYNSHFEATVMVEESAGSFTAPIYFDPDEPLDWKFYIRATTEEFMTLSPARAEYEFYTYRSPVDVIESHQEQDISLLPNPTSTQFSVRGLSFANLLSVYDLSGRKVFEQNGLQAVDVQDWGSGVYLVEITGSNGVITTERLIVCD
jgi:hypothetical protein